MEGFVSQLADATQNVTSEDNVCIVSNVTEHVSTVETLFSFIGIEGQ